jgi:hypothetical protein
MLSKAACDQCGAKKNKAHHSLPTMGQELFLNLNSCKNPSCFYTISFKIREFCMKNLKIIGFSLFVLACNAMMSIDDIEQPSTQEPIEKHIDVDFDEPIIDKKAKIKYTHTRYTVEPSPYAREEASEQNLAREEKLKKFRQQERAAKKIQSKWRSYKEDKDFTQKIEDFKRKRAATKIQRTTRNFLKEKRIENFKKTISTFADQSYPKFKELICTSDYLTKTDWIYQFIEAAENKTIFERNSDGTINPEKFTPEFEKEISNPTDWLHEKIIKYLPGFHDLVYEAFVDKAIEQIVKYKASWTDAVSVPTPKGHESFQKEGTPLFPKIYKPSDSSENELILGKIFVKILEQDPKKFEQLHFQDFIKFEKISPSQLMLTILDHLVSAVPNIKERKSEKTEDPYMHSLVLQFFYGYLKASGLELSPEDGQKLDKDFRHPGHPALAEAESDEEFQQRKNDYLNKIHEISKAQRKFIEDHINWASSARQTFYLGQLLFDKDLTAFDALGGQEWLEKQPKDIQEYITHYIKKINTEST